MLFPHPAVLFWVFGLAPPAFAAVVVLIADALDLFYGGPFIPAAGFAVAGVLCIGSPPMALSGYAIGRALRDRDTPGNVVWIAFVVGFVITTVSMLAWALLGWVVPDIYLMLGIPTVGGAAAVVLTLLAALFSRRVRLA